MTNKIDKELQHLHGAKNIKTRFIIEQTTIYFAYAYRSIKGSFMAQTFSESVWTKETELSGESINYEINLIKDGSTK